MGRRPAVDNQTFTADKIWQSARNPALRSRAAISKQHDESINIKYLSKL